MPDRDTPRRLPARDRGQATQLGLLLATVVILTLIATLQVEVAPNVQAKTEYNHAAEVIGEMQSFQSDTLTAAATGARSGTTITMGGDYPNYVILIQPPGPYGTLESTDTLTVGIENAQAVNPETADYLDGSQRQYDTKGVQYEPTYNQYEDPPTSVLRRTTVYQQYDNDQEVVADSALVTGNELQLVTSTADFSTTQGRPMLVYAEPLSQSTDTVRVEDDGDPILLQIQSDLPVSTWREMLSGEIDGDTSAASPSSDGDGKFIVEIREDTTTTPHTIEIVLETDTTYNLQMAKVGHRPAQDAAFAASDVPDEAYLTTEQSTTPVATEEETIALTMQVRDKFQNGVSDVIVDGTVVNQGSLDQVQRISQDDGTVTFYFTAPEITQPTGSVSSQTHRVRFELLSGSGQEIRIEFEVEVQNTHN